MTKEEKEQQLKQLKELMLQKEKMKHTRHKYEHDNKLLFFGVKDDVKAKEHEACCKLFRGPNPIQQQLLEAWENQQYKVFTFTGANRIGKTTIGAVIALSTLFGEWLWNGKKIKFSHAHPRKVRYIGQDWEKHIKAVVEPELKKWWPTLRPVKTKKNNFGIDAIWIDEKTGSILEIMSNNQESDLHEGWSGDLIVYDEPPKRDIRVANARGLVDRCGRELFCMTLLKEAWVDREVIRGTNEDGTPDTTIFNIHGDILVNVGYGITQEGITQFSKTLKDDEKDARLKGVPSYMSGLVYPKYDRHKHLKPRFKNGVPLDWIVDIAIDFHPTKEWAVLFLATDPRGYKWGVDEIWEHGSWKAIGEKIVRKATQGGYRIGRVIIDPLSKGDQQSDLNEESVFEKLSGLFMKYGISLFVASKDKEGGINIVSDLLMSENEMPSLFFFSDLKRTVMEIEGYMFDPDTLKPQKVEDDMMENLYRLALLNTVWYEEEDEDEYKEKRVHNVVTGY